ncbi:hypothetical protein GCM10027199_05760 [Amycolatopsis magusensis]
MPPRPDPHPRPRPFRLTRTIAERCQADTCSPARSSCSSNPDGSGQATASCGKPIRGAMHSFASAIQVVAQTSSHGSAANRGPVLGIEPGEKRIYGRTIAARSW